MKKYLVLLLIVVMAFGVVGCFEKATEKGVSTNAKAKFQSPIAELVYTGTNETLSEALYNLDKQDGKLEKPYIVHKMLGSTPDLGDNRHSLTFIDKDGKAKKEVLLESSRSKIDVYLTSKGNHALVYSDYSRGGGLMGGPVTVRYYDISGNVLWEKKNTLNSYAFFPEGELLIEDVIHKDGRTYNLINAKDKVVRQDFYSTEYPRIHPDFADATILFSPNGQYFSLQYEDGNNKTTNIMVFNRNGDLWYRKDLTDFSAENKSYLSDSGYYYVLGYEPYQKFENQIFYVFGEKGKQLYKRVQGSERRINEFAVLDDAHLYIVVRYSTPKDRLLKLINIRIPEENEAYKGASVNKVIICDDVPVISTAQWIGDVASWEIALLKNKELFSIYKYSTSGYDPYLFEINDFVCYDDLLILTKASDNVGRIYKIKR